jgi:ornithine cyclodeaminase
MAVEPPLHGAWLRPGQHVDLVGAFKPTMRETDDRAVQRALVFCDTYDGALSEGGDLVQPLQDGVITHADVLADLYMLTRGQHAGRTSNDEITLFKSVGTALEDLAAAVLAYERAGEG